jgi:hypothetical protein
MNTALLNIIMENLGSVTCIGLQKWLLLWTQECLGSCANNQMPQTQSWVCMCTLFLSIATLPFWFLSALQIDTWNGFYCDSFYPNSAKKPKICTETWSGWSVHHACHPLEFVGFKSHSSAAFSNVSLLSERDKHVMLHCFGILLAIAVDDYFIITCHIDHPSVHHTLHLSLSPLICSLN